LIDCPFRASIQCRNTGTVYILQVESPDYNHNLILPIALPQHQGLNDIEATLVAQISKAGAVPQQITTALHLTDLNMLVLVQDIYDEYQYIQ
jgi:hypothetical protein